MHYLGYLGERRLKTKRLNQAVERNNQTGAVYHPHLRYNYRVRQNSNN